MENVWIILLLTLGIVAVAILLLGVRIFFTKNGKFPNSHVGGNKAMEERGIYCVQTQDYMEWKGIKQKTKRKHKD
ncbi:MAG: hypothetical protein IKL19_03870 [Paludibacteraceae bacterium]|nr:hypothetical protein [Paludibacteraceae bacterium]MBR6659196.1 hypothetical protein [Paludibacteraceae bacterium]